MCEKILPENRVILVTVGDIRRLINMVREADSAIGRDLVHGHENGDDYDTILSNVCNDVRNCVVDRWIATIEPRLAATPMEPNASGFPDDEEWEEEYAKYGFAHKSQSEEAPEDDKSQEQKSVPEALPAQETETAADAFRQLLTDAALGAEDWIDSLELSTFPKEGKWRDEAVNNHSSVKDWGWRWEFWDEFGNDIDRWARLETAARNCGEVKDEHARLAAALEVLNHFVEVVGDYSDEFCR